MPSRPEDSVDVLGRVNVELRLIGGVHFLSFDNRKAVFSEQLQKIFELNDTGAYLAGCTVDYPTLPKLMKQLQRQGLTPAEALNTIEPFAVAWSRAGLLSVLISKIRLVPTKTATIAVAGQTVALQFYDNKLANRVLPVFAHLTARRRRAAQSLHLMSIGNLTYIFQDGKPAAVQELDQTAPVLKGVLTDMLFAREGTTLALHCAMLIRGDQALLLTGPPGAGKTTLTLNLLARGFEYAADDITLLMNDGRARGVSFAPAIKSGARTLVKGLPFQLEGPAHRRLDRRRVRYATNLKLAGQRPFRVKWIARLHRSGTGPTQWKAADLTSMLKELINGAHTFDRRLSNSQMRVLIGMIARANSGVLEYAHADKAAQLLEKMCDES
jgi:hypothetical protein